jgi:hypothetical protein
MHRATSNMERDESPHFGTISRLFLGFGFSLIFLIFLGHFHCKI